MAVITTHIDDIDVKDFDDNDIMFLKNESKLEITSYLVDRIKHICKEYKILYLSSSYKKEELLDNFKYLNKRDINVIEDSFSTIDEIEKYIINNKCDYVCIDYLKLIKTKNVFRIGNKKMKYVLDKIEEFSKKYSIIFLVVINMEDN